MIITIDGPVASGKSSVAKALAEKMNMYYLYTGLLYRAVAYVMRTQLMQQQKDGVQIAQEDFVEYVRLLQEKDCDWISTITYDYGKDAPSGESRPYLFFGKKEITPFLRESVLDQYASMVSANAFVRAALLDLQRSIAKKFDIVADGRDCGSVVFPHAEYKFYLTASTQVRAQRLMIDDTRGNVSKKLEEIIAEIEMRDARDRERAIAPLMIPEHAVVIDNSNLSFQETLEKFLSYIKR